MNILVSHFDTEHALRGQSLICNGTGFVIFNLYYTYPFDSQEINEATPMTHLENSGAFAGAPFVLYQQVLGIFHLLCK